MKKETALYSFALILLLLSGCSVSTSPLELVPLSASTPESLLSAKPSEPAGCTFDAENAETIEATEHYEIARSNSAYYFFIFDEHHEVAYSDGPLFKLPRVSMVDDDLVLFTVQAGASLGTRWGYYYDIEKDVPSRVFTSIYDQSNGRVAYYDPGKVVVRDIFDRTKYYVEISSFKEPLSEIVIEPITSVVFINDGADIEITYFTGNDYRKVTETIALP